MNMADKKLMVSTLNFYRYKEKHKTAAAIIAGRIPVDEKGRLQGVIV